MRKALWAVTLCAGAAWIGGGIAQASAAAPAGSKEDQVLQVEQQRERAQEASDIATLDKILADDLIYCHTGGRIDTKASMLDTLKKFPGRYQKITLSDTKVRIDGNMAVINGSIDFTTTGGGRGVSTQHALTTIVYEKRDGRWQMISEQSTLKPEPGADGAPAAPAPAK
jgi:uncharacterized protein (TIGR02246 family)